MKNSFYYRTISVLLITLSFLFPLSIGHAKSIDLYDKPKDGKPIAKLDSEVGIINIFTPKDSTWVKVADPRDGNVGWVKSSELDNVPVQTNMLNTTHNSRGYHIIQVRNPAYSISLSNLMQQQMLEMEQMMQDFHMGWTGFPRLASTPVFMPVIVMPVKDTASVTPKK